MGLQESKWLDQDFNRAATAVYAINIFFKIKMRPVQILAILIAMEARKQKQGRLLQVQTGEGKTNVVAALAIIEVIGGTKVDIVTSSSELAVTQFSKLKPFYNSIGLKVSHNANNNALNELGGDAAKLRMLERLRAINSGGKDSGKFVDSGNAVRVLICYLPKKKLFSAMQNLIHPITRCQFFLLIINF